MDPDIHHPPSPPPCVGQRRRGRYGEATIVRDEQLYATTDGGVRLGPYSPARLAEIWPEVVPPVGGGAPPTIPNAVDDPPLSVVARWLEVRARHGRPLPLSAEELKREAQHSSLLRWLAEGHDPLPEPPPLAHGYPAHRWALEGRGEPFEAWAMDDDHVLFQPDRPAVVIDQHPWLLVERLGAEDWVVRPYQGRTFQLGSGRWRVRSTGPRLDRHGQPVPQTGPCDRLWVLERLPDTSP